MVFLNPSILLGLLAATIPILIHILNFRKLKRVEFSTLSFLKELQKSKIKKIKIKQWLLLLIRTLIIIFLVIAFARPTLESTNIITTNSTAKSTNVFILDNSFSMLATSNDGSSYNQSKSIIKKIISEMQNEDEFYFITTTDSIEHTLDKEIALKLLERKRISNKTFNLFNSIKLGNDILLKSQNINKQIFLFSDFQKVFFDIKNDSLKTSAGNKNKFYVFPMSVSKNHNISVEGLKLKSTILELNKPLMFSALLHNYSDVVQNNILASLFINNTRVAQQNIVLNKNEEKTVSFETTLNKTGLMKAYVQIDDDDIAPDNKSFTSFSIPSKIKVLLLYDNHDDTKFIEAALSILQTSSRVEVTKKNSKYFSSINLNEFDLTVLVGGANLRDISKLHQSISEGNKLIYFPSDNTSLAQLNIFQQQLGFPKVKEIIKTKYSKNDFSQFEYIDIKHPIFSNLFSNNKKSKIESPNFYKYIKFAKTNNIKAIIKFSDNSIFLGEYNLNRGKVIFFSSALNLSWNNFPIKSLFAPLVNRLITYLTSSNKELKSYFIEEKIPIQLNNLLINNLKVKLPNGEEYVNLENNNSNIFSFSNTDVPGTYEFYNKNKLITFASINVNPKESDLTSVETEQLEKYFSKIFGKNFLLLNSKEDYLSKIKESRFGSELWKLFIGLALILALIEMLLSRSSKKDMMDIL